ncbi:MAG: transglutaminase family protein, partial [Fimbriiglobus sp.]
MDWRDSRNIFLHGLLSENRTGTCPSLPVLIVAIGRRLGYPLFLVRAPAHLFCRWEDRTTGVRFNIEYNGHGMTDHPDEHYRLWPKAWPAAVIENEAKLRPESRSYLRSLTLREEDAEFLCSRGHCLEDNGRLGEAVTAYHWA